MQFNQTGLSIESIVNIITFQKDFEAFLLDAQNSYRIQRAMWEDPNDELLTKSRGIDDIIELMKSLEPTRSEYFQKLKEEELKKLEEEMNK